MRYSSLFRLDCLEGNQVDLLMTLSFSTDFLH